MLVESCIIQTLYYSKDSCNGLFCEFLQDDSYCHDYSNRFLVIAIISNIMMDINHGYGKCTLLNNMLFLSIPKIIMTTH